MKHYTKDELERYRNRSMSVLGRLNVSSHLKQCPQCRAIMDELEDDDRFVSEMRISLQKIDEASRRKAN